MQYYEDYIITSDNNIQYGKLEINEEKYYVNNIEILNNRGILNDNVIILNNKIINIQKRSDKYIVGILYLDSKIKYGSLKDKLLFLFKPTNKKYPHFYIPYKKMNNMINIYCIIQFKEWTIFNKLPIGILIDIIGEIGNKDAECEHLRNFYEIKNNIWKIDKNKLNNDIQKLVDLQNKEADYKVFSIDPEGSLDIDDAFHFKIIDNMVEIGIHIASPYEFFKDNLLDILDRVTTVYLPSKKYNMLPNYYADNFISLIEGKNRYSLSLILLVDKNNNVTYKIKETIVNNIKNYTYENFNKIYYNDFIVFSTNFFKEDVTDPHKLVELWMIYANKTIANYLILNNCDNIILRQHLDNEAKYTIYDVNQPKQIHSKLGDSYYTHYTSPIRRAIDFYTHILLINNKINIDGNKLIERLEKINKFTKNCRKFDNKIKRLNFLYEIKELEKNIETFGIIIKISENKLTVSIPEYNLEEKIIIIPKKFKDVVDINILKDDYDNILKISYEKEGKIITHELNQKINIRLWVFTSFENFFDKLILDFV